MTVQDNSVSKAIPMSMWCSAVLIASQSFLFGYIFSSLNPCMATGNSTDGKACFHGTDSSCPSGTIYNDFNLSTIEVSMAVGLLVLGAWIGSVCGSYPGELYGRKRSLLGNCFLFIIGSALCASGNLCAFFIGRFISGLGVGAVSVLAPVLLSEIAPAEGRGVITTIHQVMVTFGIFLVGILAYGIVGSVEHGWQYIQGIPISVCLLFLALHSYVPESPKWLLRQNRREEAVSVMLRLRPEGHNAEAEAQEIVNEIKEGSSEEPTWGEVFACRKAVIIGCGLMFFQAFTGINSVIFYSTTIFGFAGFNEAILATASVGAVNFIVTVFAASLVDKFGRKMLLTIGMYTMMFALLVLSTVLYAGNDHPKAQGIVAVMATLVYIAGFACGLGAVCWVLMSEIVPNRLRTKAFSLFLNINWGCNLVIGLVTLSAIDGLGGVKSSMDDDAKSSAEKNGVAFLYYIFLAVMVLSIAFLHIYVPETKGRTPEQILGSAQVPLLADYDEEDTKRLNR